MTHNDEVEALLLRAKLQTQSEFLRLNADIVALVREELALFRQQLLAVFEADRLRRDASASPRIDPFRWPPCDGRLH